MNWEGSSTASHSTPRIPATCPTSCSVSMCCRAWPISWNSVSTSRKVISEGLAPTGGVWLHTMCAHGSRTAAPAGASALLRPITSSIHAPPRFSAGRL